MRSSKGSAGVSSAIDAARGVLVLDGASGTAFVLRPSGTTPNGSKIHSIVPLELLISEETT